MLKIRRDFLDLTRLRRSAMVSFITYAWEAGRIASILLFPNPG